MFHQNTAGPQNSNSPVLSNIASMEKSFFLGLIYDFKQQGMKIYSSLPQNTYKILCKEAVHNLIQSTSTCVSSTGDLHEANPKAALILQQVQTNNNK